MANSLVGITYSEFDNKVGPQLKYIFPTDSLSKDTFEAYSDFVIMSKQLCWKLIVVTIDELQFLNFSIAIEDSKYDRNKMTFAFGLILSKDADTEPYGAVLTKFSNKVAQMEVESSFLFEKNSGEGIQEIICSLFLNLKSSGEAFLKLDEYGDYLALKLFRKPVTPDPINDYDVPVFRSDRINLSDLPWDVSFLHLIPFIDGISHVKKIAKEAEMDIDCVKRSLTLLSYYQVVILSDVFKFSNVYKLHTDSAVSILTNPLIVQSMCEFGALDSRNRLMNPLPSSSQIISFLLKLQPHRTIRQILLDNMEGTNEDKNTHTDYIGGPLDLRNMDISRVLTIAKANGLVKRLHEYPIYLGNVENAVSNIGVNISNPNINSASDESKSEARNKAYSSPGRAFRNHLHVDLAASQTSEEDYRSFQRHMVRSRTMTGRIHQPDYFQSMRDAQHTEQLGRALQDLLHAMNGSECMDSICCRFELCYEEVIKIPNVKLIFK